MFRGGGPRHTPRSARCRRHPASRRSDGARSSMQPGYSSIAGAPRQSPVAGPILTCSAAIPIGLLPRFDCMGLVLLLDRCEVVGIDPDGADLVTASVARQRFYRRELPHGTVALWQLASR